MSVPDVTVRDRSHNDASFLEVVESSKDPALHYRWIRLDGTNSAVTKARMRGYKEVLRGEVDTIAEPEAKHEQYIVVGDVMLMACPKEVYQARMEKRAVRTQTLISSTTIEAERLAASRGIELIKDSDHKKES